MRTKQCQDTCMRLLGYGFRMNPSNTSQRLPYSGLHLWGESPGDLKQQYSTFHLTGKSGSKITAVPSMYLLEWRDVPLNVFCKYYSREKCNNYITFNATILQNIFQNILYLQQEHFWGHVEKGNAHYYTFSVFHTNKCTNFVYLNEH